MGISSNGYRFDSVMWAFLHMFTATYGYVVFHHAGVDNSNTVQNDPPTEP